MSVDHAMFDERLGDVDDLDRLPVELADHAAQCARCSQRLDLARRIQSTARALAPDEENTGSVTAAVLARTHPRTPSRSKLVAAVAVIAILISGAAIVLVNRSPDQTDPLAQIAEDYRTSDGTRFVYATEVSVNIADEFDLPATTSEGVQQLSTRIPTCTGEASDDTSGHAGLDLRPIADALANDDPCLALQLIDDSTQSAIGTYTALAASIDRATKELDVLSSNDPSSPLVAAAAIAYADQQRDSLVNADTALQELALSFNTLASTVQPLADPDSADSVSTGAVETGLVALSASTGAADTAIIEAAPTVTWTQIATGTWTPAGIDITGTTEHENHSEPYTGIGDDPLGLASVVLSSPEVLIALLDSAPPTQTDAVQWTVPDDVLTGSETWIATARVTEGQLEELTLTSTHATITFTPGR